MNTELGNKYRNAEQRLGRVRSLRRGHSENLHEVIDSLNDLTARNGEMNKQLLQLQDDLSATDTTDEGGIQKIEAALEKIVNNDWTQLTGLAQKILSVPNVEETDRLHDTMTATEKAINRVQKRLADRLNAGNRLAADKNAFNAKAEELEAELSEVEGNIQYQILDVSIDDQFIQQQQENCKSIEGKLQKTRNDLEDLERIGTDLIHASGVSAKRRSISFDAGPVGSANDGISQVTRQLFAFRNRQDEAERALHDLNRNIDETFGKRCEWNARVEDLQHWLQNENSQLAHRQNLTLDNVTLQAATKEIKNADKRLREKQPELGEVRHLAVQLINKLPAEGHEDEIDHIQTTQQSIVDNFESLENENSSLELCVSTANVLIADSGSLDKWITAKMRVMNLCSVSADPNLINNHLAHLDVLKNEIEDEKPKWQNLNDTADRLLQLSKSDSFNEEITNKVCFRYFGILQ